MTSGLETSRQDMRTRRDGVALWRQIADVLREEIAQGIYGEGARLPGELALGARFSVNRHTVRQALQELAEQGLVRTERGRGTIVKANRLDYPIGQRTRFSEIVSAQAREPRGRLLGSCEVPATAELARQLQLPEGSRIAALETLSLADGEPVGAASHWFDAIRFADMPARYSETGSITRSLEACGVMDYLRRETRVTARLATPEEASLLALRVGAPLLVTEALNVATDGRPTHVTRARFAAEKVQLVVS